MKSFTDDLEFSAWASRPFSSSEASAAAFADPRYKTSADFRAGVASKVALSDNGIAPQVYNESRKIEVTRNAETGAQVLTADEELAALYGPLAVNPSSRASSQAAVRDRAAHAQLEKPSGFSLSVREYADQK